jgi:hypothetical protein
VVRPQGNLHLRPRGRLVIKVVYPPHSRLFKRVKLARTFYPHQRFKLVVKHIRSARRHFRHYTAPFTPPCYAPSQRHCPRPLARPCYPPCPGRRPSYGILSKGLCHPKLPKAPDISLDTGYAFFEQRQPESQYSLEPQCEDQNTRQEKELLTYQDIRQNPLIPD